MTIRNEIIKNLNSFYEKEGIVPLNFNCKNSDDCEKAASGRKICYRGAQAHVGNRYGEELRTVVLSLDTGGEAENIDQRTDSIEKFSGTNPHMKGTIEFLRVIFPEKSDFECLKFFAMTNSAKCSGKDRDKLPTKAYINCAKIHEEEIKILQPQLLIAQGNDAYPDFLKPQHLSEEEYNLFCEYFNVENKDVKNGIRHTIKRYVKNVKLSEENIVPLIHGPHPSSRDGRWQIYKDISLPLINLYIQYIKQKD
jgi:hypothetical protein